VNQLIEKIFVICEEIDDNRSTLFFHLKKFREDINGCNDKNYENEIIQGLSLLNIFISSTEIHKEKRKEL